MTKIIMIAAGLLALVVLADFVIAYARSTKTGADRLWDAGRGSATIVVGQLALIGGGVDVGLAQIAQWLDMPGVADAVKSALPEAQVGAAVMIFAAISMAARLRTMGRG